MPLKVIESCILEKMGRYNTLKSENSPRSQRYGAGTMSATFSYAESSKKEGREKKRPDLEKRHDYPRMDAYKLKTNARDPDCKLLAHLWTHLFPRLIINSK